MMQVNDATNQALRLGACRLAHAPRDWNEAASLLFSPQGLEFCVEKAFPTKRMLHKLPKEILEKHGIFINAGQIEVTDMHKVAALGETEIIAHCSTPSKAYTILALHGASVLVKVSNYAVVRIYGDNVNVINDGTAKILR